MPDICATLYIQKETNYVVKIHYIIEDLLFSIYYQQNSQFSFVIKRYRLLSSLLLF